MLANALGVPTPVPGQRSTHSFLARSFSDSSSPTDLLRRSPTPSTPASSLAFSPNPPPTSRFLLHVIPPLHLPHDSANPRNTKSPPAPNTPGYHTQFRRGTLVPVHPTLHAQLGAIAKEYALPSTAGLILYLVNTSSASPAEIEPSDEPGPRLSEDIWKHLWTRVIRAEQSDILSSRSPSPLTPRSPHNPYSPASRSTPALPQEPTSSQLRPFLASPSGPEPIFPHAPQPFYPNQTTTTAPSTPSSISDRRSNNKSAPPSSFSQSEPGTPDTSVEDAAGLRANSLDLPGINSPSLIPILAKVEFDIDRRKAAWYEPWIRSRKINHAKRTATRAGSGTREDSSDGSRSAPLELETARRMKKKKKDPFGLAPDEEPNGYARLSESPEEFDSDEDDEYFDDLTAKFSGGKDPLDDVFGTDADTWADLRAERSPRKRAGGRSKHPNHHNPNVVHLALTAADLDALPDPEYDDEDFESAEEDEVREMLDIMGKPELAVLIPSPDKRQLASQNGRKGRKGPPPLVLKPKDKVVAAVLHSPGASDLAYMDASEEDPVDGQYGAQREDKRAGVVYDELDLGLDASYDLDPNDHRRSQLLMKEKLDEIERTMAQLSPRILSANLSDQQDTSFNSATLSPLSTGNRTLSPRGHLELLPSSPSPLSPRLPQHPDPPEEDSTDTSGQSWPAVPFSSIKDSMQGGEVPSSAPSPPRLAVNGITTSAPKSYMPTRQATNGPTESEKRKKELELEEAQYPPPSPGFRAPPSDSPIIPLSPDPFGRFSSTVEEPPKTIRTSGAHWDGMSIGRVPSNGMRIETKVDSPPPTTKTRSSTSSRFSADSMNGDDASSTTTKVSSSRATLMSVKGIKNLWRKSSNKSISSVNSVNSLPPIPATPTTATSSGRTSPMMPPQRPDRPSEERLDLPDMPVMPPPNFGRLSPQPQPPLPQPRPSLDSAGRRPSQDHSLVPPPPPPGPHSLVAPPPPVPHAMMPPPPPPGQPMDQMPPRLMMDQMHPQMPPQMPPQMAPPTGLSVPLFQGRNPNPGPIMAPHMQPRSKNNLDRLHFDQESPYPIRAPPPARQSSRAPSPPPPPPPMPPVAEPEKTLTARKSILKWKSSGSSSNANNGQPNGHNSTPSYSEAPPRSSFERPANANGQPARGGRRPSVINFGSTRASVTSPELPPSPPIPNQFAKNASMMNGGLESRMSQRSKVSMESYDSPPQRQSSLGARSASPPRSMTSSRDSGGSRPSFDASQFEFVSPPRPLQHRD